MKYYLCMGDESTILNYKTYLHNKKNNFWPFQGTALQYYDGMSYNNSIIPNLMICYQIISEWDKKENIEKYPFDNNLSKKLKIKVWE